MEPVRDVSLTLNKSEILAIMVEIITEPIAVNKFMKDKKEIQKKFDTLPMEVGTPISINTRPKYPVVSASGWPLPDV